LTKLPVPAPANGDTDSAIEAIRRALMAATAGRPGGEAQSVEQLRHRYQAAVDADFTNRAVVLPGLIADLHTTLAQRREMAELLPLAVLFHAGLVGTFLNVASAPIDLRWQGVMLARALAEELNDPIMLGFVAMRAAVVMLSSGAFDLARSELDATTVPTATDEGREVSGMLALNRSLLAAAEKRPAEVGAALVQQPPGGLLLAALLGETAPAAAASVAVGPVDDVDRQRDQSPQEVSGAQHRHGTHWVLRPRDSDKFVLAGGGV
jgi:hypothetical protein